jgi:hypothetical protein
LHADLEREEVRREADARRSRRPAPDERQQNIPELSRHDEMSSMTPLSPVRTAAPNTGRPSPRSSRPASSTAPIRKPIWPTPSPASSRAIPRAGSTS